MSDAEERSFSLSAIFALISFNEMVRLPLIPFMSWSSSFLSNSCLLTCAVLPERNLALILEMSVETLLVSDKHPQEEATVFEA